MSWFFFFTFHAQLLPQPPSTHFCLFRHFFYTSVPNVNIIHYSFILQRPANRRHLCFNKFKLQSVQFSCSVMSDSLRPHELQHARPPCRSPTPGVHSDSHPLSQWCHPAISSSVIPFSFCPQSLPASGSFPMNQLFAWGGQSTGVADLTSVFLMNTQDWSPLEWTSWISFSRGLSRVFSSSTVQKNQFLGAQLSSQSNSHIHTWLLEKP